MSTLSSLVGVKEKRSDSTYQFLILGNSANGPVCFWIYSIPITAVGTLLLRAISNISTFCPAFVLNTGFSIVVVDVKAGIMVRPSMVCVIHHVVLETNHSTTGACLVGITLVFILYSILVLWYESFVEELAQLSPLIIFLPHIIGGVNNRYCR